MMQENDQKNKKTVYFQNLGATNLWGRVRGLQREVLNPAL